YKENLTLRDGTKIRAIDKGERIRYLGCSFEDKLVLDSSTTNTLTENLLKLGDSNLLNPTQKIGIINTYTFPTLVYQLQAAPLSELKSSVTDRIDNTITDTVTTTTGIPSTTTTAMC